MTNDHYKVLTFLEIYTLQSAEPNSLGDQIANWWWPKFPWRPNGVQNGSLGCFEQFRTPSGRYLVLALAFTLNNCDEFTFVRGCNVTSPNCLDWRWYIFNIECLPWLFVIFCDVWRVARVRRYLSLFWHTDIFGSFVGNGWLFWKYQKTNLFKLKWLSAKVEF